MAETASLTELAGAELNAASSAIIGGDPEIDRLAGEIRQAVTAVNRESRTAIDAAERLHGDDMMNPHGKARLLAEIPANLLSATRAQLDQAELNLDLIEGRHLASILHHNAREDGTLIAEIQNYVTGLEPATATETLIGLASDVRYSTMMAGPFGRSLAARFKLKDSSIFTKVALEALATNGSTDQVGRSKALEGIAAMRRVLALAKGGRDAAVEVVKRPPKPEPSAALM